MASSAGFTMKENTNLLEALNKVLKISWPELGNVAVRDTNPVTVGMPNADCVFELLSHWMER